MAPCIDIMQALEVEYLQHSFLSIWRPMQLTMQAPKYSSGGTSCRTMRWCGGARACPTAGMRSGRPARRTASPKFPHPSTADLDHSLHLPAGQCAGAGAPERAPLRACDQGGRRGALLALSFHIHPLQTLTTPCISLQDNALVRGRPSVLHCGHAIRAAGEAHC